MRGKTGGWVGWVGWLRVPMGLVAVARLKSSAGQLSGPRQAQASPTVKTMTEMRYVDLFFKHAKCHRVIGRYIFAYQPQIL